MPSTVRAGSGWQPRLGLILAFATVALALILSACGGGSSDGSDNLTSADEVLAKASEAVNSVTSFRSESIIEMIEGSSSDGQSSQTAKMTLAWSAPNRFHLRIAVADEDGQTQEYISTDGKVALRDSMTGDVWTEYDIDEGPEIPGSRASLALVIRHSAAPDLIPAFDEAELVEMMEIDGISVYHVKGSSSSILGPPDHLPADSGSRLPESADRFGL